MTSRLVDGQSDAGLNRPAESFLYGRFLRAIGKGFSLTQHSWLLAGLLLLGCCLGLDSTASAQFPFPVGARPAANPYPQLGPPPGSQPVAAANRPHPAVVRIIVPEKNGTSYGSGTLVDVRDQYGLVVTNWHVVRDAADRIEVVFPDGFRSFGQALKVDKDWDLAALVIWKPNVEPVPLAAAAPQPGDALTIAGYGQGTYRSLTGHCTQYLSPTVQLPREMVEVSVAARQGDSGGPIFNAKGELAGVLWGAGSATTLGSYTGRVEGFLASVAPHLGTQNGTQIAARLRDAPPIRTPFANQMLGAGDRNPVDRIAKNSSRPAVSTEAKDQAPSIEAKIPSVSSDAGMVAIETGKLAQTQTIGKTESAPSESTETADEDSEPVEASAYAQAVAEAMAREDAAREKALLREEAEFLAPRGMDPSLEDGFRTKLETASSLNGGSAPLAATIAAGQEAEPDGAESEGIIEIPLTWQDIAGESYFEQAKTILAGLGLLAVVHFFWRRSNEHEEEE